MNPSFIKYILVLSIIFAGSVELQAQKTKNLFVKKYDYNKLLKTNNQYSFHKNITFLKLDNYWGAIDTTGKIIVPFRYDSVYVCDNNKNLIEVRKNEKLGLYNLKGKLISKSIYTYYFFEGLQYYNTADEIGVISRHGKRGKRRTKGKINTDGKVLEKDKVLPIPICQPIMGEFAIMKTKKKWYIYRNDSLIKFEPDFDTLIIPRFEEQGKTILHTFYVNSTFRWSKTKNRKKYRKLRHVTSFYYAANGKLIARKNNMYGIIDSSCRVIGTYDYDEIGDFYLDFAKVKKDGKYGLLNSNGHLAGAVKYDDIILNLNHAWRSQWYYHFYDEEKAKVKTNEGWGFINTKGEEICKTFYDSISRFYSDVALVMKTGKWGVIDKDCKEVLPYVYDSLDFLKACPRQQLGSHESYEISNKRFLTKKGNKFVAIDRNGNETTEDECDK